MEKIEISEETRKKIKDEEGIGTSKIVDGYKIVRTYSAGVFFGKLEKIDGKVVTMRNARRIYYWDGAASLSQMAMEGVSKPKNCRFPIAVDKVVLTETIEVLDVTEKAKKSIDGVSIWKE